MTKKELIVYLTNSCNLNCSFCKEKKIGCYTEDNPVALFSEVIKASKRTVYENIQIVGGEPLYHLDRFFKLYRILMAQGNQPWVSLMTNAYSLTTDVAEYMAQYRHPRTLLTVNISTTALSTGIKNLSLLEEKVKVLREYNIPYVCTIVCSPKEYFVNKVKAVWDIQDVKVSIKFDNTVPVQKEDLTHLTEQLQELYEYTPDLGKYLHIPGVFRKVCTCSQENDCVLSDGTLTDAATVRGLENVPDREEGCKLLYSTMDSGVYKRFKEIVSYYLGR